MKKSKLLLSLVALLVCTMTFAQRDIPESNEVLFDDNGSFTRVVNTPFFYYLHFHNQPGTTIKQCKSYGTFCI